MNAATAKMKRDLWNALFSLLFIVLVAVAISIITSVHGSAIPPLTMLEIVVIIIALFRLTRLFVYDGIMAFVRDWFLIVTVHDDGAIEREKRPYGPRRSVSDILSCPWCFSVWASAIVLFLYALFPVVMFFILLLLAISGLASILQLSANLLGWSAEKKKLKVQKMERD